MVQSHPSTPAERVQWTSYMLAHSGEYGLITQLSRTLNVSRPTLYAWKAAAQQALTQAFRATPPATSEPPTLERQILTLLVEGHTSYTNIQTCLATLTGQHLSIGTIAAVVQAAQQRAQQWMTTHAPASPRTLALDEIYANNRQGAYLNVVDTDSWAVWAAEGPLSVDADSWTLLLWLAQDRGLRWHATVSDGGDALRAACQAVDPNGRHQRDVWHLFHFWNQIQRRVTRRLTTLQAQTATVARQAARIAAGQKARGHHPRTDLAAHQAEVAQVQQTDADLRALGHELQRVLAVVVLDREGVRDLARRHQDLVALVDLVAEVQAQAGAPLQGEIKRLHTQLDLRGASYRAGTVRGKESEARRPTSRDGNGIFRRIAGENGTCRTPEAQRARSGTQSIQKFRRRLGASARHLIPFHARGAVAPTCPRWDVTRHSVLRIKRERLLSSGWRFGLVSTNVCSPLAGASGLYRRAERRGRAR